VGSRPRLFQPIDESRSSSRVKRVIRVNASQLPREAKAMAETGSKTSNANFVVIRRFQPEMISNTLMLLETRAGLDPVA
jgi:hypothetical protein